VIRAELTETERSYVVAALRFFAEYFSDRGPLALLGSADPLVIDAKARAVRCAMIADRMED